MLVAKEKIKSNVGEYIIYMYQIEDLIRACKLDNSIIESQLVSQYKADDALKNEIKQWYFGLVELMEEEKVQEKGHLSFITNKINEVNEFHLYLLEHKDFTDYQEKHKLITPLLVELTKKQPEEQNAVQLIVDAVYGYYLLKLKKQEISNTTLDSISQLSGFLAELSLNFRKYEKGDIKIE